MKIPFKEKGFNGTPAGLNPWVWADRFRKKWGPDRGDMREDGRAPTRRRDQESREIRRRAWKRSRAKVLAEFIAAAKRK